MVDSQHRDVLATFKESCSPASRRQVHTHAHSLELTLTLAHSLLGESEARRLRLLHAFWKGLSTQVSAKLRLKGPLDKEGKGRRKKRRKKRKLPVLCSLGDEDARGQMRTGQRGDAEKTADGRKGMSSPSLTQTLQQGQRPGHRRPGEYQGVLCVLGRH